MLMYAFELLGGSDRRRRPVGGPLSSSALGVGDGESRRGTPVWGPRVGGVTCEVETPLCNWRC